MSKGVGGVLAYHRFGGKQTTVIRLRWHFKSSCAQNISSHQPFLDVINDKRTFFHNIGYNLKIHDLFTK